MYDITIRDKFGEVLEQHKHAGSITDFVKQQAPSYKKLERPPFSAHAAGKLIVVDDFDNDISSDIDLIIEPAAPVVVALVVSLAAAAYAYKVASDIDINAQDSVEDGQSIYRPNARANQARPNAPVPEVAGNMQVYPDIIAPPYRRFEDNEEKLYMLLAITRGVHSGGELFISESRAEDFGGVTYEMYRPGEFITDLKHRQIWYTSPEVSNLELLTAVDYKPLLGTSTKLSITGDIAEITRQQPDGTAVDAFDIQEQEVLEFRGDYTGFVQVSSINQPSPGTASQYKLLKMEPANGETGRLKVVEREAFRGTFKDTGRGARRRVANRGRRRLVTREQVDEGATFNNVEVIGIRGGIAWYGPYAALPDGEKTTIIEIDFLFPAGLALIQDGEEKPVSVTVEIEHYDASVTNAQRYYTQKTFTNSTISELGETVIIYTEGPIRPFVRIRRVTTESDSIDVYDEVRVARIKATPTSKNSYEDVSTLAVTFGDSQNISQSAENTINIRNGNRLLGDWSLLRANARRSVAVYPNNSSRYQSRSIMRFLATMIIDAIGKEAEDKIDFTEFERLDRILEDRGDYLDIDFSDETTLWEAIKIVLSAAYAAPTIKEGVLLPVREDVGDDFQQMFTPDIMLGEGLTIDHALYDPQEPDGIEVEYFDLELNTNVTVLAALEDDTRLNPKRVQANGITQRDQAYRLGMRQRRRAKYKPARYSFDTELDALNCNYGAPVLICSDLFGGQQSIVISSNASGVSIADNYDPTILSAEYPEGTGRTGQVYAIFRSPEGKASPLIPVTVSQFSTVLQMDRNLIGFELSTDEEEPTLVSFGQESELAKRAIIKRVTPNGDNTVSVVAEEYVAEIYASDNDTAPEI